MSNLFQVGDHVILTGNDGDSKRVGWIESAMRKQVGVEFVVSAILASGIDKRSGAEYQNVHLKYLDGAKAGWIYDSEWLIRAEDADFDTTAIDEMFAGISVVD